MGQAASGVTVNAQHHHIRLRDNYPLEGNKLHHVTDRCLAIPHLNIVMHAPLKMHEPADNAAMCSSRLDIFSGKGACPSFLPPQLKESGS